MIGLRLVKRIESVVSWLLITVSASPYSGVEGVSVRMNASSWPPQNVVTMSEQVALSRIVIVLFEANDIAFDLTLLCS
jgi:hypothetical protein